ncbi:MAG: PIN domain-containing protein [Acidobacteria bacterium]|nr:PIN domain-containing protein [Acidobacteriota bacterium]
MTSGTSDKTFVDTNVLIYAHDVDAGRKHDIAKDLLRALWADRAGMVSMQVLQEFYVNATRKIRKPLTKPEARSVVDTYTPWCVDGTMPGDIIAAFQIEDQARIRFWDALIIAVATRSGARRIVSEDLNAGQSIAGLTSHNPFKAGTQAKSRR